MIQHFEANVDPIVSVSLYYVVHWILQAWKYDISNTTIYNCFWKSTVIQPQIHNLPSQPVPDLSTLYVETQHADQIREAMSLHDFINPTNENLVDIAENDDLSEIISFHLSHDIETAESDHEEGDLQPPVQPPSLK